MNPPNLTSLDPSIMKMIIGEGDDSLDGLRLISPTWNTAVKEYLATTKLGSIERVYLYSGLPDDDAQPRMMGLGMHRSIGKNVQMVAILPEKHRNNIGVGDWLSVFQQHNGDAMEVTSSPQRSEVIKTPEKVEEKDEPVQEYPQTLVEAPSDAGKIKSSNNVQHYVGFMPSMHPHYVGFMPSMHPLMPQVKEDRGKRNFPQLARLFNMFSCIDNLVLEHNVHYGPHGIKDSFLDEIGATLGDIRVNRIDVRIRNLNEDAQNSIVELCRTNRIRHLFFPNCQFKINDKFREFMKKLAALDVIVDIYEHSGQNQQIYFGKSRVFWDKMAEDLEKEEVSLRIATTHDAAFANAGYQHRARAHVRCEKAPANQPLVPVDIKRGFNLNLY